jgi:Ser/Thr protein kinase RdoA (MazF antagonist)
VATESRTVLPLPDGSPEPLAGGWKNELTRYGDVVLRLERTPVESVAWEHRLLRFLAERVPEVVVPVAGPDRWEDGRTASLLPYVAGRRLDVSSLAERRALGSLLADIHVAGLGWNGGPRPERPAFMDLDLVVNDWWDWRIVEKPHALAAAYDEMVEFLFDPPPLVVGAVHGDVDAANVLVGNGVIVGVLDWEYARVDWPAWELANAAWKLGADAVDAYVEAGGPAETGLLPVLTRFRHVNDVLYSLTSKARGEPYNEEHVARLLEALS